MLGQYITKQGTPLIIGGPLATTDPRFAARVTGADAVVVGEGEDAMFDAIANAAKHQRKGRPGFYVGTPCCDLDKLPLPNWGELAPPDAYPKACGGRIRGVLAVTRGCPFKCTFCSVHTVHGRAHRRMSQWRITEQLLTLARLGVEYYCFLDDNLFISENAVDEVLGAIAEAKAAVGKASKRWRFYNEEGIEIRMAAKPGMLARIKEAGFVEIALGLETLSKVNRKAVNKPYHERDLKRVVKEAKAAGITPKAFYIIGFPGDTPETVCKDIARLGRMGFLVRPNNLKLYPGTDITKQFIKEGWISSGYD